MPPLLHSLRLSEPRAAMRLWAVALPLFVLALTLWAVNPLAYAPVQVSVTFSSPQAATLELFWAESSAEFSGQRRQRRPYQAGTQTLEFRLPALAQRRFVLRLDPIPHSTEVVFHGLTVKRPGFAPLQVDTHGDTVVWRTHQARLAPEPGGGLRLIGQGEDPYVFIEVRPRMQALGLLLSVLLIATGAGIAWLLCWGAGCVDGRGRTLVYGLSAAGVFMLFAMSEAPFSTVLIKDAFTYIEKAFEITEGNWSLQHRKAIGWPILTAVIWRRQVDR